MAGDHDRSDSDRPSHRPATMRWVEGVMQPVIAALLIALLAGLIQIHDDISRMKLHLVLIEQTLKLPQLP